jgi:CRP/FNR family transcriptional regulator
VIPDDVLAGLPLFDGAGPGVVPALARRAVEVSFAPGTVLFLAGSQPRGWFIVLDGMVRVVRGSGPRQHVVHTETRGGTLGEVPLFGGAVHPATGIAAEPTRCALITRSALEGAIAECPEIAFLINRRLALRVRDLVARLDERVSRSVRDRLIAFLLERARSATRPIVSVGMTQQQLAEELGTVREVVSREMRRLAREQLIQSLSGGRYRIPDLARLRAARESD